MNYEDNAQKVHKKVHKKLFYCKDIYVCDNFVFLFHFFGIIIAIQGFIHH